MSVVRGVNSEPLTCQDKQIIGNRIVHHFTHRIIDYPVIRFRHGLPSHTER